MSKNRIRFDYWILRFGCDLEPRIIQDVLVRWGELGWELVGPPSLVPQNGGGGIFWYHLKRPLED